MTMKINKLEFEGRVLGDVKTKTFGSGKTLHEWSMGVGVKIEGQWKNAFIRAKHWGDSAPQRGEDIVVTGRLGAEVWTKDGRDQSKITIICESFSVIEQITSAHVEQKVNGYAFDNYNPNDSDSLPF